MTHVSQRVAREHGFAWTVADDAKPGDEQWFAGRWLTIQSISHLGSVKRFHYTDGDFRDWSVRQSLGIRPRNGSSADHWEEDQT